MATKKTAICKVCQTVFKARRGAKTCSPTCRKRLQRYLKTQAADRAARFESAMGQEFHRLAAELFHSHVSYTPLAANDERGAVMVPGMAVKPEPTVQPVSPVVVPPTVVPPRPQPARVITPRPAAPAPLPANPLQLSDSSDLEAPGAPNEYQVPEEMPVRGRGFSLFRFNRTAMLITTCALLLIALIGGGSFLLIGQHGNKPTNQAVSSSATSYAVSSLSLDNLGASPALAVGQAKQVTINGQLKVTNSVVLAPENAPATPTAGQIYYDQSTNAPYYYNGTQFVSLAPTATPQHVTSLGGASGILALGTGLQVNGNQLAISSALLQTIANSGTITQGVTALNGLTGALTLNNSSTSGSTITIADASTAEKGIAEFNASDFVSSGGVIDTVQGITPTSAAQFGSLALTTGNLVLVPGASVYADNILNSGTGDNIVLNAGSNNVEFENQGGANTFFLPTTGGTGQTICTTGITCAAGGGQAVILEPNTAQTASSNLTSIFINKNGGSGNIIELQDNGNNAFVVANTGAASFGDSLAVQGGSLTVGTPGTTAGNLDLANATSGREVVLQGLNPSGTGNATVQIPSIPGSSTDTVCLETLANCVGTGGSVSTTGGTQNFVTKYNNTGATQLTSSEIYDNGNGVSIGNTSVPGLFNVGASNQFQVASTGAVTAVGINSGSGVIQGTGGLSISGNSTIAGTLSSLTGLTSAGTITFSGLNAAGVVHTNGSGVLSTSAVILGTDTSGNYVANLGSLTGLTTSGNSGAGSTPTLSVTYGSGANTAAEGNAALSFTGSGNLTGTVSGTAGGGLTSNTLAVVNSPTFSGTLTVQGGSVTVGVAGTTTGGLYLANSSNTNLGLLQAARPSGTGTATYTLPSIAGGSSDTVCLLTLSNCVGSGSGGAIGGGGTAGTIALFTGSGYSIGNSVLTQSGSAVTDSGTLAVSTLGSSGSTVLCYNGSDQLAGCSGTAGSGNYILNGTSLQTNANFAIQSASASSVGALIQAASGQTADLFDVQNSGGSNLFSVNNSGNVSIAVGNSLGVDRVTSNGNFATQFVPAEGSIFEASDGAAYTPLTIQGASSQTADLLDLETNTPTTILSVSASGAVLSQNSADSTTAFQIQNAAGTNNLFDADTTDGFIGIGTNAPADALDIHVNNSQYGLRITDNGSGDGIQIQGDFPSINFNQYYNGSNHVAIGNGYTGGIDVNPMLGVMDFLVGGNPGAGNATTLSVAESLSSTGQALFQNVSNSTTAFRVLNASSGNLLQGDTTDDSFAINGASTSAGYNLNISGTANASSNIYVNGVAVCTVTACAGSSGSGSYIQNGTSIQTNANFNIQSASSSSVGAVIEGAAGQAADLLDLKTSTPATVLSVGATGNTTFENSTNSTTAFQIQNAADNSNLFVADTTNSLVGIGVAPTTAVGTTLQVGGSVELINSSNTLEGYVIQDNASGAQFRFGDYNAASPSFSDGLQGGYGDKAQLYSYYGLVITGNTANTAPSFTAGSSSNAGVTIQNTQAGSVAAAIQGVSGQSADLLDLDNSSGQVLSGFNSSGNLYLGQASGATGTEQFFNSSGSGSITLTPASPSSSTYTITIPAETGTICTTAGSAACVSTYGGSGVGGISGSGTSGQIAVFNGTSSITGSSSLSQSGTAITDSGTLALTTLGSPTSASYLCYNSSNQIAGCSTTGSGAAFVQGGNSFGAQAVLGTNDANSLALETSGTTRAVLDTSGNLTFQQASTLSTSTGTLTLQGASGTVSLGSSTNLTASGALTVASGGTNTALNINTDGTGGINIGTNASGNNTIQIGNTSGTNTQTIDIGNNSTTSSTNNVNIGSAIAGTVTLTGATVKQTITGGSDTVASVTTNNASAFVVQNAAGQAVLTQSTSGSGLTINQGYLSVGGISNPSTPTLTTASSGGSLTSNDYYYLVSAIGPAGETAAVASSPTNENIVSGIHNKNTVTWSAVTDATSYNVYRSINGGTTWYVNNVTSTSLVDNGTTYTWATVGSPQQYVNYTGTIALVQGAPILWNNGSASVYYSALGNALVSNTSGSIYEQSNGFVYEDAANGNANEFTVTNGGQAFFQNAINSTTAFQIQDIYDLNVLTADTTSDKVIIGNIYSAASQINAADGTLLYLQPGAGGPTDSGNILINNRAEFGYDGTNSAVQIEGTSGKNIELQVNGNTTTDALFINTSGASTFENNTNSSAAFLVENASSQAVLTQNTSNSALTINQGSLNVNGISNPTTPTLTTASTGGSLTSNDYYYLVSAIGPAGESEAIAPSPTNENITSGIHNKNTVTWSAVTDATSYNVYRSTNAGVTWYVNNVSGTSLVDNGTTYTWTSVGNPDPFNNQTDAINLQSGGMINWANNSGTSLYQGGEDLEEDATSGAIGFQTGGLVYQDSANSYAEEFTVTNGGQTLFENAVNSTTALQVQNSGGGLDVLDVDTTNGRVGIGTAAPVSPLDVAGSNNGGYSASIRNVNAGSSAYAGLFFGNNTNNTGAGYIFQGSSTYTGYGGNNSLNIIDSLNSNLTLGTQNNVNETISGSGTANFKNATNSTTGFQIQNSSSSPIFDTDTSNSRVGINTATPSGALTVEQKGSDNIFTGLGSGGSTYAYIDDIGNLWLNGGFEDYGTTDINGQTEIQYTSTSALQVESGGGTQVLTVDTSGNNVNVGQASAITGNLQFFNSSGSGSIKLTPANPSSTGYTITVPAETGTICTTAGSAACTSVYGGSAGTYLAKNSADTSSAAVTSSNYLYTFTNSSSTVASGVLSLNNGTNTNNTLNVTTSGNPGSGQAVIQGSDTNASPTGYLLALNAGSTPTSEFSVSAAGVTASANSFVAPLLQSGASTALTITGNAASTWSTSAGNLTIQAASTNTLALDTAGAGTVSLGHTNATTVNIGNITAATAVTIQGGTSSTAISIQSGTSGTISIGTSGVANTIQIGNTSGTNTQTIDIGNNSTTSSTNNVNIGSAIAGTVTLTGATVKQTITGGSDTVASVTTNNASAFVVQNASGQAVLTQSTSTSGLTINEGYLTVSGLSDPTTPTLTTASSGGSLGINDYYYLVSAVGASGETAAIAPSPTNENITSGSANKNTVTWSAVTDATSYNVYRSINGGTTWYVNNVTSTSLVDNGTTYTWTVTGSPAQYANDTGQISLIQGAPINWGGVSEIYYNATGNALAISTNALLYEQSDGLAYADEANGSADEFTVQNGGQTVFENAINSTTAFQVQNASGIALLNADTSNMRVSVGANGTATGQLYVSGSVPSSALQTYTLTNSKPQDIISSGHYVYVANFGDGSTIAGFSIYDNSNTAAPVLVSTTTEHGGVTKRVQALALAGHYLYTVDYNASAQMNVWDVSNPDVPAYVGSVTLSGNGDSVVIDGSYAYVATLAGVDVINIVNPDNPVKITTITSGLTLGQINSVFADGRYIYAGDDGKGGSNDSYIKVIDTTTNTVVGSFELSGGTTASMGYTCNSGTFGPRQVYVQGKWAFATNCGNNKIDVFDVSNPTATVTTPTYSISTGSGIGAYELTAQGRYLYATLGNNSGGTPETLDTYDISQLGTSAPTLVGAVNTNNDGVGLAVNGRYAYVADFSSSAWQTFDLGGEYTQQLEAGGIETNTLSVDNDANISGDASIAGGVQIGQSLQVNGNEGVNGQVTFQNASNSTTAFQVQNASGTSLVTADTTDGKVIVNNTSAGTISSVQLWNGDSTNDASLSVAPHTIGNLMAVAINIEASGYSYYVTSVSGGGVSDWHQVQVDRNSVVDNEIWEGTVTSTGSTTITVGYNTPTGVTNEISAQEFTAGLGANTHWSVSTANDIIAYSTPSTSLVWPSLTAQQSGELYWGYINPSSHGSAGSTSGFTYSVTATNSLITYNTNTAANTTYAPTATQATGGGPYSGVAMIVSATEAGALTVNGNTGVNGGLDIQAGANSTTAFQVQNASGLTALNFDTTSDNLNVDYGGLNLMGIDPPATPTLTKTTTGGGLANSTTYYYEVAADAGNGETEAIPSSPTSETTANTTSYDTVSWSTVPGAIQYAVYRSINAGANWSVTYITASNSTYCSSSTCTIVDNGTNFSWGNSQAYPANYYNSTGDLLLSDNAGIYFGDDGEGIQDYDYGSQLQIGSDNTIALQGDSLIYQDKNNGYDEEFTIGNGGQVNLENAINSATAFVIQNSGAAADALVVSTNNVGGTYNSANAILKVAKDTGTNRSINAAGTINASGADYAEYIPWSGPQPGEGSIVSYEGSDYVVSSTDQAAFVGGGNLDPDNSILVSFAGQVEVDVTGPVNAGDILIDNGDGTAKAVDPSQATVGDLLAKIGIAQESASGSGVNLVEAAIGTTSSNTLALQQTNDNFSSINVTGTATVNDLTVTGTATIATLEVTGSSQFDGDISIDGHIITTGGEPTSQVQAAAGNGGTITTSGDDTTGTITITTGSNPTAGALAELVFSKSYGAAPHIVLSPSNDAAAGLRFYKGTTTPANFMFNSLDTPTANTTYQYDYFIAQ